MSKPTFDEAALRDWLIQRIAKQIEVDPATIDPATSFESLGMDSILAVRMVGDIEKLLKMKLPPALLFEYPTIDGLAGFLAQEIKNSAAGAASTNNATQLQN